MVPLTTLQGLAPDAVRARADGRPVVIWGTGDLGLDALVSLRRCGLSPRAFLHSRPGGEVAHGLPVEAVDAVLTLPAAKRPVVVIASGAFRRAAETACAAAGLVRDRDYFSHLILPRPAAVVEVAAPGGACLPAADFGRVLTKLLADQPLLCHLELAWQGDPLAHPALPELVAAAEARVPCTVTTALAADDALPALLAAAPSRLNLLAPDLDGPGATAFLARLERLRATLVPDRRTRVLLKVARRRGQAPDTLARWTRLLADSPILLSPEMPYPSPYDPLLAACLAGGPVAGRFPELSWDLDGALAAARADGNLPCLSQRVFPVIGADRSVGLCHLYQSPRLAPDYLAVSWAELLAHRHRAPHCASCQNHGLHRLDLPVLARRHPTFAATLDESTP